MSDNELILPSDPAIRKKIRDAVQEASAQQQMVDDRKEAIKDIANLVETDYQIPKKVFNRMVKAFHKQMYIDMVSEDETFQALYEGVMENKS